MLYIVLSLIAYLIVPQNAAAQEGKGVRFWNLTSSTIVSLRLSPAGENFWGKNLCESDKDGVEHDERLKIAGVKPGNYDAKLKAEGGRECFARNIEIKPNAVFSIDDKALSDCTK